MISSLNKRIIRNNYLLLEIYIRDRRGKREKRPFSDLNRYIPLRFHQFFFLPQEAIAVSSFPGKVISLRGRFPRKYSPYRCFPVQFPGPVVSTALFFDIADIWRIFWGTRGTIFLRGRPADSRRCYYDPSRHDPIVCIQGVRDSHRFYRKIFPVTAPYIDSRDAASRVI